MEVPVRELVPIEKSIDLTRAWYRNAKLKGPLTSLPKPGGPLLSSLRAKIKVAMAT
jgi:hypothetical protein